MYLYEGAEPRPNDGDPGHQQRPQWGHPCRYHIQRAGVPGTPHGEKRDTPSCRLASWLQPDRAMDLDASELTLPMEPVKVGASLEFTLCMKDQDGKPVFVDDMKVCRSSLYCLLQGFSKLTKSCSHFLKILPTTVDNKGRLYGK